MDGVKGKAWKKAKEKNDWLRVKLPCWNLSEVKIRPDSSSTPFTKWHFSLLFFYRALFFTLQFAVSTLSERSDLRAYISPARRCWLLNCFSKDWIFCFHWFSRERWTGKLLTVKRVWTTYRFAGRRNLALGWVMPFHTSFNSGLSKHCWTKFLLSFSLFPSLKNSLDRKTDFFIR